MAWDVFNLLSAIADGVVNALGPGSEAVVHRLDRLPLSVVHVAGNVTGRHPGAPATDVLIESLLVNGEDHQWGYLTRLDDNRLIRSSTIIVRDDRGEAVAAFCLNTDVTQWEAISTWAAGLIGELSPRTKLQPGPRTPSSDSTEIRSASADPPKSSAGPSSHDSVSASTEVPAKQETFFHTVDEAADFLVQSVIQQVKIPVELMKKDHKKQVVHTLHELGLFNLRNGVDRVAQALDVSRYTIYNYLNELGLQASSQQ